MATDTSDFSKGMAIKLDGDVYTILDFQHVKPGKGGAFVRTKLRRVRNGATLERTFRSGEKVDSTFLEKVEYQFLYRTGEELTLMDQDSYEQVQVGASELGEASRFLKEEMKVLALVSEGETLGYELPNFVELAIAQTDPGERGNTVSGGATKPATLETGAVVQVPFHINEGDVVKVDTRSGEYLERISKK